MNFLAIDVGNTNLTIGVHNEAQWCAQARIVSSLRRTSDEWKWLFERFLIDHHFQSSIDQIGIASVVPSVTSLAVQALAQLLPNVTCNVVGVHKIPPMKIAYLPPSAVGADRICNVIAGVAQWGAPLIVIDFGTATTLDAVDESGTYLGGAIAPGIETSMESLAGKTAQLTAVDLKIPEHAIGNTTVDAIRSGLLWGALAAADGLAQRFSSEMKTDPMVVATGGWGRLLYPHSKMIRVYAPDLVLDGIRLICLQK